MLEKLGLKINFDKSRVYGLDILRAFAISIVVLTHSVTYLPGGAGKIIYNTALDGVSIFFVLSGFLIGRILIKLMLTEHLGFNILMDFWWRRWLRTLPIYFFILSLVIFAYNYPTFTAPTFKRFYIFSQNIFTPHPGFFIEAWSLSVEEWFYLLVPLLTFIFVKFLKVNLFTSILIISFAVILFSTAVRFERYLVYHPVNAVKFEMLFRMQVVTRLDSLVFGVLGALFSFFSYEIWIAKKELKLITGIIILIINKVFTVVEQNSAEGLYYCVFYFSLNSAGTLLLLPYLSTYKKQRGIVYKTVTYLSVISYSVYLINLTPVQEYIMPFINNHILQKFAGSKTIKNIDLLLYFPIIVFVAAYLYKFVETPFLNYRNKRSFSGAIKTTANEHAPGV